MSNMRFIHTDGYTEVVLEGKFPEEVCKLGQGPPVCIFLTMGAMGFVCCKESALANTLKGRHARGEMTATGLGGWAGCAWELP